MSAKPVPNFAERRPSPNVVALGRGIKQVLKLNGKNIARFPRAIIS
jgi:hypothetical protein